MTRPREIRLLFVVCLVMSGCGEAVPSPGASLQVDTLDTGVVRVRNGLPPGVVDTLDHPLVLGSLEGPVRWGRVGGIALGPEGTIVILDELAHRVRAFDAEGRFLWGFGREGPGPSELLTPLGVIRDADGALWIPDSRNLRYTVLSREGTLLETVPRSLRWAYRWRGAFLSDGRILEVTSIPSLFDPNHAVPGLVVGLPGGADRDTVRIPYHPPAAFRPPSRSPRGGAVLAPSVPFVPRLEVAPDPRGFVWVGFGDRYRVAQLDLSGDTVGVVESAAPPLEVLPAEADSALAALREQFPAYRRSLDAGRLPEHHPHFSDLLVADDGFLWVRRPLRSPGTRFHVFDSSGVFCGALHLPVRLEDAHTVVDRGRLAGIVEDEVGVERVFVFRFREACGASQASDS